VLAPGRRNTAARRVRQTAVVRAGKKALRCATRKYHLARRRGAMLPPITIGNITIHRVVEGQLPLFAPLEFFPSLSKEVLDENRSWLEPEYVDRTTGKVVLCIQSYIVKTPHAVIMIDSCVGNHIFP
jgi:hypothetical protein